MIPFGPQKPSCVGSSLPSNFSHYTKVYLKQNKIVYWSMSWTLPTLWFAFNSGKYCGCNSMDWASSLTTMAGQENGWQLYSWYYSHKKTSCSVVNYQTTSAQFLSKWSQLRNVEVCRARWLILDCFINPSCRRHAGSVGGMIKLFLYLAWIINTNNNCTVVFLGTDFRPITIHTWVV